VSLRLRPAGRLLTERDLVRFFGEPRVAVSFFFLWPPVIVLVSQILNDQALLRPLVRLSRHFFVFFPGLLLDAAILSYIFLYSVVSCESLFQLRSRSLGLFPLPRLRRPQITGPTCFSCLLVYAFSRHDHLAAQTAPARPFPLVFSPRSTKISNRQKADISRSLTRPITPYLCLHS